jgi:hypothetical protein
MCFEGGSSIREKNGQQNIFHQRNDLTISHRKHVILSHTTQRQTVITAQMSPTTGYMTRANDTSQGAERERE